MCLGGANLCVRPVYQFVYIDRFIPFGGDTSRWFVRSFIFNPFGVEVTFSMYSPPAAPVVTEC